MAEIPEAPYIFTYEILTIDGKKGKVFRLGKYGKEKLEKAIDKDTFHSRIGELNSTIQGLAEIIGRNKIIEHFKEKFLQRIKTSAKHRSDLVGMPFWFEKNNALKQLLEEGQVFYSQKGGWIKLKEA